MTTFILIIALYSGGVTTQEFDNRLACEEAQRAYLAAHSKNLRSAGPAVALCMSKS